MGPAALLLLVSHLTDCWPMAIVKSPLNTINFKRGTSTIIINGSDSFTLYDHGPEPSIYRIYPLADINVLAQLMGAQLTQAQSILCSVLSLALRALAPPAS